MRLMVNMLKVPMYPDPKPPTNRTGAGDAMTSTFVVALGPRKIASEALLGADKLNVGRATGGAQRASLTRGASQISC